MKKRVPPSLKRAHAYWRLSAKAERQGDLYAADHYRRLAERAFRKYQRLYDTEGDQK